MRRKRRTRKIRTETDDQIYKKQRFKDMSVVQRYQSVTKAFVFQGTISVVLLTALLFSPQILLPFFWTRPIHMFCETLLSVIRLLKSNTVDIL